MLAWKGSFVSDVYLKRISIDTAEHSALKLGNLSSLKVVR